MIKHSFLFVFLALFSLNSFACGTVANWMDAYEGVTTGNDWRDSMNPMESLVMLMGCEGDNPSRLGMAEQQRLSRILSDAMSKSSVLTSMPSKHPDIEDKVKRFRHPVSFDAMVESIYRRYQCLPSVTKKVFLNKKIGNNSCSDDEVVLMEITAKSGGRLRAIPRGRIVTTLAHKTNIEVLGYNGEWYKVINPVNTKGEEAMVGFVHESVLAFTK